MNVYIIDGEHAGELVAFKVGVSDNPEKRLRHLQSGSPVKLVLAVVATVRTAVRGSGAYHLERALHAKLAAHRLHGEWFAPAARELAERCLEHVAKASEHPLAFVRGFAEVLKEVN